MTEYSGSKSGTLIGVLCVVLSAIGFSTKSIFVKLAYADAVDATTLLALRMLFSLPVFLGFAVWKSAGGATAQLQTRDWVQITLLGLLGYYFASYLDFLGLQYLSAALERLVLFLYPTLVLLLGWIWFRRPVSSRQWFAIGLSYLGIALALGTVPVAANDGMITGALLVLGSGLAYAVYLSGAGEFIAMLGSITFTGYALSVSCFACILQFLLTHSIADLRLPESVYAYALAMAMVSTVVPAFLMAEGIRRIGASHAAVVSTLGPVATMILAQRVLDEAITPLQTAGAALVIAGVTLVTTGKDR